MSSCSVITITVFLMSFHLTFFVFFVYSIVLKINFVKYVLFSKLTFHVDFRLMGCYSCLKVNEGRRDNDAG